ncbi:hypothetical protein G6F63_014567 [Rhizopus arrhizus]|nr:hypothetical protein G6F63_014567 [Rhizopus arrhizus]
MWGANHAYQAMEGRDSGNNRNYLVMGPWRHSQVNYSGNELGALKFDGDTALQFRRDVLKPFFDQYLVDGAPKADTPPVLIYNTGENHWDRLKGWPRSCDKGCAASSKPLYLRAGGKLAFQAPAAGEGDFEEYRPRHVDHLAGQGPALRRWPPGCADVHHRTAERAAAHWRCAGGAPAGIDQWHRQRLGGEAD